MIEIQCTSCQTRYRIDERILPEDTPTFKCSRCGHVFSAEPRPKATRRANAEGARGAASAKSERRPAGGAADASPAARASVDDERFASAPAAEDLASQQPRPEPPPAADAAGASSAAQTQDPGPRQAGIASPRATLQPSAERAPDPSPTAEPERAAEPRTQSEQPPPPRHDTRELLQRPFGNLSNDEGDKPGENLAFDFNDEQRSPDSTLHRYAEEKWEVGDTDVPPPPTPRLKRRIRISDLEDDPGGDPNPDQGPGRGQAPNQDAEQDFERIRPEEVSAQAHRLEAELRGRSYKLHSAGYFIGLFALMIFGFGIVTMVIQSAPVASAGLLSALPIVGAGLEPPISPARRVALNEVQAQYTTLKGNQTALVISGTVENLTSSALGAVRIEAALTESGPEPLRSQAVYCGNSLSSKMIGEMTPHEIEFFEKLDAPKSFTLAPQATAPFVIVFIEPPAGTGHFQLRVVRADPAAAAPPATDGG